MLEQFNQGKKVCYDHDIFHSRWAQGMHRSLQFLFEILKVRDDLKYVGEYVKIILKYFLGK